MRDRFERAFVQGRKILKILRAVKVQVVDGFSKTEKGLFI